VEREAETARLLARQEAETARLLARQEAERLAADMEP
jgi:hypothetical protein